MRMIAKMLGKGMGSIKSGEMKQMIHETTPHMMRECFGRMDAEDRKETRPCAAQSWLTWKGSLPEWKRSVVGLTRPTSGEITGKEAL